MPCGQKGNCRFNLSKFLLDLCSFRGQQPQREKEDGSGLTDVVQSSAKHLGLTIPASKSLTYQTGMVRAEYSQKIAKVRNQALHAKYSLAMNRGQGMPAYMALQIVRPFAGGLYYGTPNSDIPKTLFKQIYTAVGELAKAGLGLPRCYSTQQTLSFAGWQTPETESMTRTLNLFCSSHKFHQLRDLRTRLLTGSANYRAKFHLRLEQRIKACIPAEDFVNLVPQSDADWIAWNVKHPSSQHVQVWKKEVLRNMPRNIQSPMLKYALHHAHIAVRYTGKSMIPFDREKIRKCPLCSRDKFTPAHVLLKCSHPSITKYTSQFLNFNDRHVAYAAVTSRNFSPLNRYLKSLDKSLPILSPRGTPDKNINNLLFCNADRNDLLDVIARLIRAKSLNGYQDVNALNWFVLQHTFEWQDMTEDKQNDTPETQAKSQLFSAYNLLGYLIADVHKAINEVDWKIPLPQLPLPPPIPAIDPPIPPVEPFFPIAPIDILQNIIQFPPIQHPIIRQRNHRFVVGGIFANLPPPPD
jgi:hypothetical protein